MSKKLAYPCFVGYLGKQDTVALIDRIGRDCIPPNIAFVTSEKMQEIEATTENLKPEETGDVSVKNSGTGSPSLFSLLPKPSDFPNADVVIFDGKCVFCTRQVSNLRRLDGRNRLTFISLHDSFVGEHFPDLTHDEMMKQMYVVPSAFDGTGYSPTRYGGAAALRYLTRRLPKLWLAAPLLHIPFSLPVWQWGYKLVAKRRYRIAGKTGTQCDPDGTCDLHFKE